VHLKKKVARSVTGVKPVVGEKHFCRQASNLEIDIQRIRKEKSETNSIERNRTERKKYITVV
jgi:hypothetical protein